MKNFDSRLYSLSVSNLFKHSFFYFFVLGKNSITGVISNDINIKVSSFSKNTITKKGKLLFLYSKNKQSFCLSKMINIFNTLGEKKQLLLYNTVIYNQKYIYDYSIKKIYNNWLKVFTFKKELVPLVNIKLPITRYNAYLITLNMWLKKQICTIIFENINKFDINKVLISNVYN